MCLDEQYLATAEDWDNAGLLVVNLCRSRSAILDFFTVPLKTPIGGRGIFDLT